MPESVANVTFGEAAAGSRAAEALLRPAGIAVWARDAELFEALRAGGFRGRLHGPGPHGLDLADVDLALVDLEPEATLSVARACARGGVRVLCAMGPGSAASPRGVAYGAELSAICRAAGMRLIGPGSAGLVLDDPASPLRAARIALPPGPGALAVLAGRPETASAIIGLCSGRGVGISSFIGLGEGVDVAAEDVLTELVAEPRNRVIALDVDSVRDPGRLEGLLRRVGHRRPVIALDPLRGAGDRRLSGIGAIRVETAAQLVDVSRLLLDQPRPTGRRVAILANHPGAAALLLEACRRHGLPTPALPEALQERLAGRLRTVLRVMNPVLLSDATTSGSFARAVAEMAELAEIAENPWDALIIAARPSRAAALGDLRAAIAGALHGAAPVCAATVLFDPASDPVSLTHPEGRTVTVFHTPEDAVRALGRMLEWSERHRAGTSL